MPAFKLTEAQFHKIADRLQSQPQPMQAKSILLAYKVLIDGERVADVGRAYGVSDAMVSKVCMRFKEVAGFTPEKDFEARVRAALDESGVSDTFRRKVARLLKSIGLVL